MADWAARIIALVYAEISPSGMGLRFRDTTAGTDLDQRESGFEWANTGFHSGVCRKFVTLMGRAIDGAAMELLTLPKANRQAIWDRWEEHRREKDLPSVRQFSDMYPPGQRLWVGENAAPSGP